MSIVTMSAVTFSSMMSLLAAFAPFLVHAQEYPTYTLATQYDATNFFQAFDFIERVNAENDGIAHYRGLQDAINTGLAHTKNDQVYLGVDNNNVVIGNGGRPSISVQSKEPWNGGLLIADFEHIPAEGCGAWPAFWAVNSIANPFYYAEIDLLETVSLDTRNALTLYTSSTCTMSHGSGPADNKPWASRLDCGDMTPASIRNPKQDGKMKGCGVEAQDGTYGKSVNRNGGGLWAMQLDTEAIKAWWIPKDRIPEQLRDGETEGIDPDSWEVNPVMNFKVESCDVKTAFKHMRLSLNINFCGAYASHAWNGYNNGTYNNCAESTGVQNCEAFVRNNPNAFDETYFAINSLRLFERESDD